MYQVLLKWTTWTAPKSMHTSKNSQLVYGRGLIHDGSIHCMLAPPHPVSVNNSGFCSTHNCSSPLLYTTKVKLHVLQPSTRSTWLWSPTSLAYGHQTWAFSFGHSGTVAFLLLLDTNMLSQEGITHYSQLHDMTALFYILKTNKKLI